MSEMTYTVPDLSCSHCKQAVRSEMAEVLGVECVDVDLDNQVVTIRGHDLDDRRLCEAIAEAGYEAA